MGKNDGQRECRLHTIIIKLEVELDIAIFEFLIKGISRVLL